MKYKRIFAKKGKKSNEITSKNCFTVVSTIINGRWIKWTTPFLTGIFAFTISAITTPIECLESPTIVFDFTYTVYERILVKVLGDLSSSKTYISCVFHLVGWKMWWSLSNCLQMRQFRRVRLMEQQQWKILCLEWSV